MTTYHKIETIYERDPKTHKLLPELILKNRVYGIIKTWHWTEKIDGTNIRCLWKDGKLTFGGKTDNAQLHADLVTYLHDAVSSERMAEIFPDTDAVIYGEGYGAGIQKGGEYSSEKRFIVFDVRVADDLRPWENAWWLSMENVCDVADKLGLPVVPYEGEMTLEQATEIVREGFRSSLGNNPEAEGLVGRPVETLFDKKGHRLIVKLKTKDF